MALTVCMFLKHAHMTAATARLVFRPKRVLSECSALAHMVARCSLLVAPARLHCTFRSSSFSAVPALRPCSPATLAHEHRNVYMSHLRNKRTSTIGT